MQPLIMHGWNKSAERDADLLCTTALHCFILMLFACDLLKSVPGAKSWFSSLCFLFCSASCELSGDARGDGVCPPA